METLDAMLRRNLETVPDRVFLIAGDLRLTYAAFGDAVARMAAVLAAQGIGRGDRVGLYLPSTPVMAVAFWACQRIGAVPAPLSAMLRHAEIGRILAGADLAALIAQTETWAYLSQGTVALPPRVLVAGGAPPGALDLDAACAAAEPLLAPVPVRLADTAALFFSSGTTGTPKAIAQSHFALSSSWRDMMVAHAARHGEAVYLCAVPLFTNFGLNVHLNLCLYTGGTLVLHERWDTEAVLTSMRQHQVTHFGGTPTMYVYIVGGYDPARHDLRSLRVCTTGGAPVPQPVIQSFERMSGVRVSQVYGATEVCGQAVMEPQFGPRKPGSAGLPVGSSRVAILGEDGTPLPMGEVGEVVIGGDCLSSGYAGNPQATAEAFGPLGWLSGDLGRLDDDGFLFIMDRKKDVIFAGGHNVYPLEVESTLYRHPAVAVCAVVGVPDPVKGEMPVAVVVRAPGASATAEELRLWCRESLAAYKAPRRVEFIDEMPVEAAKIRKRALVEALRDGTLDQFRTHPS